MDIDLRVVDSKVARALNWQNVRHQPHPLYPDSPGEWIGESDHYSAGKRIDFVPHFSQSIQLAFSWIIQRIQEKTSLAISYSHKSKQWSVVMYDDINKAAALEASLPLAICYAFLNYTRANGNGKN
jgi:hypothetical protein